MLGATTAATANKARPPEAVVALEETHQRAIVRAFLAQRALPYLVGVALKLVVRLVLLFAPSQLLDLPMAASSGITLLVMIWVLWDLFRAPLARATHKAQLPFALNGKVTTFLAMRAKAHAGLRGLALEEALVADLRSPATSSTSSTSSTPSTPAAASAPVRNGA